MPNFWLGLMLILLFSLKLGWLPSGGGDSWTAYVLPAITLGGRIIIPRDKFVAWIEEQAEKKFQ